mgnify:CR=1 FL=1
MNYIPVVLFFPSMFLGLPKKCNLLPLFLYNGLFKPFGDINLRGVDELFGKIRSLLFTFIASISIEGFGNFLELLFSEIYLFKLSKDFSLFYNSFDFICKLFPLYFLWLSTFVYINSQWIKFWPLGWIFSILLLLKISIIFSSLFLLRIISLCIISIFCYNLSIFLNGSDSLSQNFIMFYFWGTNFLLRIYLNFC